MVTVALALEIAVEKAIRNKMSYAQAYERLPGFVARQLGITVAEFHEALSLEGPNAMDQMADRVLSRFTPEEYKIFGGTFAKGKK